VTVKTITQVSTEISISCTTVVNIDNNKKCFLLGHQIRMISEGSRGTEDWSNDAENSALHQRNKLHLKIEKLS